MINRNYYYQKHIIHFVKQALMWAMGLIFLAACGSESDVTTTTSQVSFNATITQKGFFNSWEAGSRIGVYMTPAGQSLAATPGASRNMAFTTSTTQGHFLGEGNMSYPADGSSVDFVAYYPYTASANGTEVSLDISDQTQAEAFDVLYSNNLKSRTASVQAPTLQFKHVLAKVTIPINAPSGVSLENATAYLKDIPTTATLNLADGTISNLGNPQDIELQLTPGVNSRTATALVIPQSGLTLKLEIDIPNKAPIEVIVSSNATATQDSELRMPAVSFTAPGGSGSGEVTQYGGYVELPTVTASQLAQSNIKYITHSFLYNSKTYRSYEMLYDTDLKIAYWVAYPLCNFYTTSNVSRTNEWGYDPALSTTQQANLSGGISGYDRGHQIPSADRLVCREANVQTFYYTNMTPQLGSGLNQTIWANLEIAVRGWSSGIDTLYVVTGAMPTSTAQPSKKYAYDRSGQRICVPAYYFKALCRLDRTTGKAYTIAFYFDHKNYSSSDSYKNYAISVKELEDLTGFTFFPTVSSQYKSSFDWNIWR